MGFFDWFSRKPKPSLDPELEAIFKKLNDFLSNEDQQNQGYPDEVAALVQGGASVDRLSGASGEFGRSISNPIPVNGPIGEIIYLSRLATDGGQQVLAHRFGSVHNIDVYEMVSIDGRNWDFLYFSMYHPRKSRAAPTGYQIRSMQEAPLIYATNRGLERFPIGLSEAVSLTTQQLIGIPLRSPQIRQAEEKVEFTPAAAHLARRLELRNHTP